MTNINRLFSAKKKTFFTIYVSDGHFAHVNEHWNKLLPNGTMKFDFNCQKNILKNVDDQATKIQTDCRQAPEALVY